MLTWHAIELESVYYTKDGIISYSLKFNKRSRSRHDSEPY